jgi:hypothetical protein
MNPLRRIYHKQQSENETLIQPFIEDEIKIPFSKWNIIKLMVLIVFQLNSIRSSGRF